MTNRTTAPIATRNGRSIDLTFRVMDDNGIYQMHNDWETAIKFIESDPELDAVIVINETNTPAAVYRAKGPDHWTFF